MTPIPTRPLGFLLGSPTAIIKIDVYLDLCCPYSKKMWVTLYSTLFPSLEASNPGVVSFRILLTPQPWHPQSPMMTEAAVAVQMVDPTNIAAYVDAVYAVQEQFFDGNTYGKTREAINGELVAVAASLGVDGPSVAALLRWDEVSLNSGNATGQMLKWLARNHRAHGVHVTPTVFINDIEASQLSSGTTSEEWRQLITPLI